MIKVMRSRSMKPTKTLSKMCQFLKSPEKNLRTPPSKTIRSINSKMKATAKHALMMSQPLQLLSPSALRPRKTVFKITRKVPIISTMTIGSRVRAHNTAREGCRKSCIGEKCVSCACILPLVSSEFVTWSITASCKLITSSTRSAPKASSICSTLVRFTSWMRVAVTGGALCWECSCNRSWIRLIVSWSIKTRPCCVQASRHRSSVRGSLAQAPISSGSNSAINDCSFARCVFRPSSISPRSSWEKARRNMALDEPPLVGLSSSSLPAFLGLVPSLATVSSLPL
mmetsp:Transcript_86949/g.250854  ORF Transcript_86949/g.250854 Transcript_86949/m.250854 type:complete len:284 (-) Transcript_86949:128-979(-)